MADEYSQPFDFLPKLLDFLVEAGPLSSQREGRLIIAKQFMR
jgi:hypothetical protein